MKNFKKFIPYIASAVIGMLIFTTITFYRSSHTCYMDGYGDGEDDAYGSIQASVSDIIYLAQTLVPMEKNWGEEDYPEEQEVFNGTCDKPEMEGWRLDQSDCTYYPNDCLNGKC